MSNGRENRYGRLANELDPFYGDARRQMLRFLHLGLEDPESDARSSLIMLSTQNDRNVKGQLWVAPDIKSLPMIQRTGTASPYMSGWALGLEGDEITDPALQRYKSLPFTVAAWRQEVRELAEKIKEDIKNGVTSDVLAHARVGRAIPPEPSLTGAEYWGALVDWFFGEPSQKIEPLVEDLKPQEGMGLVEELNARLPKQSQEAPEKDSNLFASRVLALERCASIQTYDLRHLGGERIKRLSGRVEGKLERLVIGAAGDLSMNQYNLALYRNDKNQVEIFIPEAEPYTKRSYHCLVGWHANANPSSRSNSACNLGEHLSICDLRIAPNGVWLKGTDDADDTELSAEMEFALYGKLILSDGKVVPHEETIDEFQDIRHVFRLPNLNPEKCLAGVRQEFRRLAKEHKFNIEDNGVLDPEAVVRFVAGDIRQQIEALLEGYDSSIEADEAGKITRVVISSLARDAPPPAIEHTIDPIKYLDHHKEEFWKNGLAETPRPLFGRPQETAVWLLEYALLRNPELRRLACKGAIEVPLHDLGAIKHWVSYCLLKSGYRRHRYPNAVKQEGDFAWIDGPPPKLKVWLARQTYPCNVVAIGRPLRSDDKDPKDNGGTEDTPKPKAGSDSHQPEEPNTLYLLAWGHDFSAGSFTIQDCAKLLASLGARYALVLDEGQDVFQADIDRTSYLNRESSNDPQVEFENREQSGQSLDDFMPVPIAFDKKSGQMKRTGLHASIAYWQERKERKG